MVWVAITLYHKEPYIPLRGVELEGELSLYHFFVSNQVAIIVLSIPSSDTTNKRARQKEGVGSTNAGCCIYLLTHLSVQ